MVASPGGRAADRAHALRHTASHADLLFDASLDLSDQLRVPLGPQQIRPAFEIAVAVSGSGDPPRLRHYLRAVDTGRLALGGPLMVKDPAFAQEQLPQPLQALGLEPLIVPVHLIVTQPHCKGVYLLRLQRRLGILIDVRQLLRGRGPGRLLAPLLLDLQAHSPLPS